MKSERQTKDLSDANQIIFLGMKCVRGGFGSAGETDGKDLMKELVKVISNSYTISLVS